MPHTTDFDHIPTVRFRKPNPAHRNPAVIAAEFTLHTLVTGETVTGVIYHDGACSCSEYDQDGRCYHAAAWQIAEMVREVTRQLSADADERAIQETLVEWLRQDPQMTAEEAAEYMLAEEWYPSRRVDEESYAYADLMEGW